MNPSSFTPNAVIFFSLLVLSISPPRNVYSDEEKFNNCAPTFCGGKKVDYPFWGNQSPVYCGLDGFQLDCIEGKFLTLDIDDLKYNIMDIDLEHNSSFLTMNRADLLSSICPEPNGFLHTSLDHTPFRTTIADEIATFYYYCDTVAYNVPYNFTCSIWNMSHQGYFLFPGTPGDEIEELKCDITVDIPVLKSAIAAFIGKKIGVQEFLKRGLEVSWFVDLKQRVECVSSGGRCGHNRSLNSFSCFCPHNLTSCSSYFPQAPASTELSPSRSGTSAFSFSALITFLVLHLDSKISLPKLIKGNCF